MEKVGIIAFAFGQQLTETAGPSNEAIGRAALDVAHEEQAWGNDTYLATQWEVAVYCDQRGESPEFVVSVYNDPQTHYIDTKGVLDASLEYFAAHGVTRIILVAHPAHLLAIRILIATRRWGIGNTWVDWKYNAETLRIPYDKSPGNHQKWTRGPVGFVAYLFKALLTKKHGN